MDKIVFQVLRCTHVHKHVTEITSQTCPHSQSGGIPCFYTLRRKWFVGLPPWRNHCQFLYGTLYHRCEVSKLPDKEPFCLQGSLELECFSMVYYKSSTTCGQFCLYFIYKLEKCFCDAFCIHYFTFYTSPRLVCAFEISITVWLYCLLMSVLYIS